MAGGARRLAILARLSGPDGHVGTARLCEVCAEVVGVDGAGIMLMSHDVAEGTLATTDAVAGKIEDLQYTLGEGPCVDAYRLGGPVLEADLADPVVARWPVFAPGALAVGVGAIFGFPLRVGAVRLGALNLYRLRPGPLSDEAHADALAMADVVGETILALQARAPEGLVSTELEANANFRFVVAQASGMVSVQLAVTVTRALVQLRGYAFAHDRPLDDVAADVVSGRLRLDDLPDETGAPI